MCLESGMVGNDNWGDTHEGPGGENWAFKTQDSALVVQGKNLG